MDIRQKIRRYVIPWALIVLVYILINWATDFKFISLYDFRLFVILLLGTLLLGMLAKKNDAEKQLERFRFNLFFMSIIETFYLLLDFPVSSTNDSIILVLKPIAYGLIIYMIGNNLMLQIKKPSSPDSPIKPQDVLSRRELEIYELILRGLTNKEMSEKLFIAESTVKKHVQNILKKLEADNKEALIERHHDQ